MCDQAAGIRIPHGEKQVVVPLEEPRRSEQPDRPSVPTD